MDESSPRAWGCFCWLGPCPAGLEVFPTCVGVFPAYFLCFPRGGSLPHVRGGVSQRRADVDVADESSPRAWGCFSKSGGSGMNFPVFPTCVGVFLYTATERIHDAGLPHVRGGVSLKLQKLLYFVQSSPRAWGCFSPPRLPPWRGWVFPTCVGVFPIHL